MRPRLLHPLSHPLLLGVLLAGLVLRGLIPAGYMPSGEAPFALELCRAGLPATPQEPDHAPSTQQGMDSALCAFGAAPGGAPLSEPFVLAVAPAAAARLQAAPDPAPLATHRHRVHLPRAPPLFS